MSSDYVEKGEAVSYVIDNHYDEIKQYVLEKENIFDDKKSHEIQNSIDQLIDKIECCWIGFNQNDLSSINKTLRMIRDSIPCSCGSENE